MTRALVLDEPEIEQRHGFDEGEWVHTIEPTICWMGDYDPPRPTGFTRRDGSPGMATWGNCHNFEGEVMFMGWRLAVLTTQMTKREVVFGRVYEPHRILVYQNIDPKNLRRGPRPPKRALVLDELQPVAP